MTDRTGRNDPCPCGSGKKYKHCCLNATNSDEDKVSRAIPHALAWLQSHHGRAVHEAVDGALFDDLDEDEVQCYDDLDDETRQYISVQAYEWLLAEGEILVRGKPRRVSSLLLEAGGPTLNNAQRAWLAQLAATPLRLYVVTNVEPGQAMTLCDVLDSDAEPVTVSERTASRAEVLGTTIGLRVMNENGIYKLSGMTYPFSPAQASHLLEWIREAGESGTQPLAAEELSFMIRRAWIAQFLEEPELPTLIDHYSNEPLLFVTDRYRVRDWERVAAVLGAQPDVEGNPDHGWERRIDCDDGQIRIAAGITRTRDSKHLTVFYRTQRYADDGRHWFETLMEDAVQFRIRDIQDPVSALSRMTDDELPAPASDVPPELATPAIRQALQRIHANWPDEPLPALGNQSPREAIATPTGLERVKGMLRTYQHGENRQAELQRREPVSFQFLWDALGLTPE